MSSARSSGVILGRFPAHTSNASSATFRFSAMLAFGMTPGRYSNTRKPRSQAFLYSGVVIFFGLVITLMVGRFSSTKRTPEASKSRPGAIPCWRLRRVRR